MDPQSTIGAIATLFNAILLIADGLVHLQLRVFHLYSIYGISAIPLQLFGSQTTWRLQAQILGEMRDEAAMAFKESVYNECTMISVAVRNTPLPSNSHSD